METEGSRSLRVGGARNQANGLRGLTARLAAGEAKDEEWTAAEGAICVSGCVAVGLGCRRGNGRESGITPLRERGGEVEDSRVARRRNVVF
jgi:hypothetical protein